MNTDGKVQLTAQQLVLGMLSLCITIIGFFLVTTLQSINLQLDKHEDRINAIEKNQAANNSILKRIEERLYNIDHKIDEKFDRYDQNLQKFYQDYKQQKH